MRLALYGSALLVVVNATLIACSTAAPPPADSAGNDSQPETAPTTTTTAPTDPAAAATVAPTATATAAPTATIDPVTGLPIPMPGTVPTGVPTSTGPSTACLPDSIVETEGNNDVTTPNTIPTQSASYCGRLEAGDVDVVQFIMPQAMRQFSYRPEVGFGDVTIEATAGGQPFDPNGFWPFVGGGAYVFKISAPGNMRPVDYRLRFTFNP